MSGEPEIVKEWKKIKSKTIRTRELHIENLYELLQKSFCEQNYCRASEILEILLKCPECDIFRIWQPAIGVLATLDPNSTAFIDFFNILLSKDYTKKGDKDVENADKQMIIMELVFYQIKYQRTIDAFSTIETYLPQEPYCNNPLLYGYAGLISYSLWEQLNAKIKKAEPDIVVVGYKPPKRKNASKKIIPPRERSKRKRNVDGKSDNFIEEVDIDDQIIDQHGQYYENGLRNFKVSLDMDMSNDMFLVYYVKLLLYKEEIEEAITTIQNFCNKNPSILTGHRLLFEVLYTYEKLECKWVEVGKTYHRIDPVSSPDKVFNPLMEHYTQVIEKADKDKDILTDAYFNMCELLFQRIEYGDDNSDHLYKAIESLVWLEHFDDTDKIKINELLKNRGKWFREFLFYTQKKEINTWLEFQCYRILNECLNFNIKCCYIVEKIKQHILSGKDFRNILYNFDKKNYYGNVDGKNINWNTDWNTDTVDWSNSEWNVYSSDLMNDLRSNNDDDYLE